MRPRNDGGKQTVKTYTVSPYVSLSTSVCGRVRVRKSKRHRVFTTHHMLAGRMRHLVLSYVNTCKSFISNTNQYKYRLPSFKQRYKHIRLLKKPSKTLSAHGGTHRCVFSVVAGVVGETTRT